MRFPFPTKHTFAAVAGALLSLALVLPARAVERDFTFFMTSDSHFGLAKKEDPEGSAAAHAEHNAGRLKEMLATIGQPYPKIGSLAALAEAKVAKPLGVLLAGDLTDGGNNPTQWPRFEGVFPAAGVDNGTIPVFLSAGNHDGSPSGATRKGIVARNRLAFESKQVSRISENGLHTAWSWKGVHVINVNLCGADTTDEETPFKYGQPGKGSWNDPLEALAFLGSYLKEVVKDSGEPVMIIQHYGFCEGFNFDWEWWSAKQRRAFYEAIKDYNIVALLHGHTHAAAHYTWPDASVSDKEVKRLFGDNPPADMRHFEVFSGGSLQAGTFYVFRILNDQLIAAHRGPDGWNKDESMYSVKSLLPGKK